MKKLILPFLLILFINLTLWAQSPDLFNYQAVVRDSEGEIMANENVELEISILYGTATGIAIYTETFNKVTNQFGLISLKIGSGTTSDDITTIDWSEGMYFLKVNVDGTELGTTQLLTVPFAKFADEAGNSFSGNYNDLTNLPNFSGWDMSANDDFSGDYNDLDNLPDFNLWDKNSLDDFSGNYDDLVNAPTFAGWDKNVVDDFSGDYNDLVNTPEITDTSNFISIANPVVGDLAYFNGTKWESLNNGAESQVLGVESGIPKWKSVIGIDTVKRIGELYLGGIIFYVSPDGQHGLVASLDDIDGGSGVGWSSITSTASGASSFYDGSSNTDLIIAQGAASSAAQLCRDLGSEWHLPSAWELRLMHNAAYEINRILDSDGDSGTNGLKTSSGAIYWTSTEYSNNLAWDYSVDSGNSTDSNKNGNYRVRAVREF
ncbi:hypothetical protein ACFLS4_05675 [Bacteroidota bacterium]